MEQNRRNDELEIDLLELLRVVLQRWLVIALAAIVLALGAYWGAKVLVTPLYKSTTSIYAANNKESELTYTDLQTGTQLTKDYVVLMKSRAVVEQVIQEMELDMTYEQFLGTLEVATISDTRMLNISVSHPDPFMARELANKVREVGVTHIKSVMDVKTINMAEEGNLPTAPYNTSSLKWAVMGGLLGAIVVAGIYIVRYLMDDTIKTPDDVQKYLGISNLASIPINSVAPQKGASGGSKAKAKKPAKAAKPANVEKKED